MSERKPSAREVMIKGALIHNPVLIQCAGLCPVVAAASDLKSAAMLAGAVSIVTIVTCIIASALFKKIPRWLRVSLYLIVGIAIICPVLLFIETKTLININLGMKIYIPLMAVNSMTAVHCEQFSVKNNVKLAFYDAFAVAIGSSVVLMICGAVRELFGNSTVGGIPVKLPMTLRGAVMPFGALILLGFLSAVTKAITAYYYPEFVQESDRIIKRKKKNTDGEAIEVEIFDEFWNISEPEEIKLDEYDELWETTFDIFDFDTKDGDGE